MNFHQVKMDWKIFKGKQIEWGWEKLMNSELYELHRNKWLLNREECSVLGYFWKDGEQWKGLSPCGMENTWRN